MHNKFNSLVSIIIPVYNGSNYMREAIDSALAQTYSNIEVLVINDGSNDDDATRNIALSYGDRIRYFEKENGGVATALNFGIAKMKGDFFSWLSHDDVYYNYKIEKQIEFYYNNSPGSIIFSHEDFIDSDGKMIQKGRPFVFNEKELVFRLLYDRFIGGCSLLIPKKAFDEVGFFSEKYKTVQDYDMWFRILNHGYKFKYLKITSGKSRIHSDQDSNKLRDIWREEINSFFIELQEWLNEDLWLNIWNNKALIYLKLARNYKKSIGHGVYKYNLEMARKEIIGFSLPKKVIYYLYYMYIKAV